MSDLPRPVNSEQQFLAAICDRLDEQNRLLAGLCDRLPAPSGQPAAPDPQDTPQPVQVTEPASPASADPGSAPLTEPKRPRKSATRTTASRGTTAGNRRTKTGQKES